MEGDNTHLCQSPVGGRGRDLEHKARKRGRKQSPVKEETSLCGWSPRYLEVLTRVTLALHHQS